MKQYIQTTNPSTQLKIRLYYDKGGMNYFTSSTEPRGYKVSVTPVNLSECGRIETTAAFSGYKKTIKETKRYSQKTFDKLVDSFDLKSPEIDSLILAVLKKNQLKLTT